MRDALFFLSLSALLSLYGILGMSLGALPAIALFTFASWFVFIKGTKSMFSFFAIIQIALVLFRGVFVLPFSHSMNIVLIVLTILLIFLYVRESHDVDIAPTFSIFVAMMFFLRTFMHILISEKLSWSIIALLAVASIIDDWNVRYRVFEERDEVQCVNK